MSEPFTANEVAEMDNVQPPGIPNLPTIVDAPPEGGDSSHLSTSLNTSRPRRNLSVSSLRPPGQNFPGSKRQSSVGNDFGASFRVASRVRASVSSGSDGVDRVAMLLQMYPPMAIVGTAFENQLRRRSNMDSCEASMRSFVSMADALAPEVSTSDLAVSMEKVRPSESVLGIAARMKRARMWQIIIVQVAAQLKLRERFRRTRLRAALETHLLPTLLRRRGEAVESKQRGWIYRSSSHEFPAQLRDGEGQLVQGSFLTERWPLLAALASARLSEALAACVARYRYAAGEAIVDVGSSAQESLFILISGKCDAIRYIVQDEKRTVERRRLVAGENFGGIFGGNATFAETYRAISQCIIWVVTRENFEREFDEHATDVMCNEYIKWFQRHHEEQLELTYPLPQSFSRVPIYRRIDHSLEAYVNDFVPLILTKGAILFEEGDQSGVVYCLLEGEVCREQRGPDMTYETGVRQLLTPNDGDNSFSLSTRFVLIGEETHILPRPLRYRCTVASRVALFYRIEGERFVSALLDDAKLLLELREKLVTQVRTWMKLAPEALLTVPMLRGLSRHSLASIAHTAEPRVMERSSSICEPARAIREIYLITSGRIMDPRQLNRRPTRGVEPPTEEEEVSAEDSVPQGRNRTGKDKVSVAINSVTGTHGVTSTHHNSGAGNSTHATFAAPHGGQGGKSVGGGGGCASMRSPQRLPEGRRPVGNATAASLAETYTSVSVDASGAPRWSFFAATCTHASPTVLSNTPLVYPDEQQELSPPLPPNPARAIVYTAGGGWEGLLVDKWPNGWETTMTVELWAVPMLAVRTEFNAMPKSVQNTHLAYVRQVQMIELGLPAPVVAKLPPLSSYLPPEKRMTQHSLAAPDKAGSPMATAFQSHSSRGTSLRGRHNTDFSSSRLSGSDISAGSQCPDGNARRGPSGRKKRPPRLVLQRTPSKVALRRVEALTSHLGHSHLDGNSPTGDPAGTRREERPRKAGPPRLLYLRKHANGASEEMPEVTPELCAIYAGDQDPAESGILRHPPELKGRPALARQRHEQRLLQNLQESQIAWPVQAARRKQWFATVPLYEPLPGTLENHTRLMGLPRLVPNTALMVRRDQRYGTKLSSQVTYFTNLAQLRQNEGEQTRRTASPRQSPMASPTKGTVAIITTQSTPGRYAYDQ